MRGKRKLEGWPDITTATVKLGEKITDREVSGDESNSNHKYLKFNIKYENICYQRHRSENKYGKYAKFEKKMKQIRNKYIK